MKEIIEILQQYAYKGTYVNAIKKANLWHMIESVKKSESLTDSERVYVFLNQDVEWICGGGNKKIFSGISRGYRKYCSDKLCSFCLVEKSKAMAKGVFDKYGVDNIGKLPSAIENRKKFWENPDSVTKSKEKRKKTLIEKYGVDNYWKRTDLVEQSMIEKYGVRNPGLMDDHIEKMKATNLELYGVEWSASSDEVNERRKSTNLEKYGVDIPMKNKSVSQKMVDTKTKNGGFDVSNSSLEATEYFRKYILEKGYSMTQVAFADSENGLHEWGYYFDRWYLYDFVAFEQGHRGDASKILEIVEYNGPFHYTEEEAKDRGSEKAAPWASSKMTIAESVERDKRKENFARTLTENYRIVWAEKYHNKRK
jgi:hypothetical protein